MKSSILKRIGLIALAVCVAIGSFFVPLKSDINVNSAYAVSDVTIPNGKTFYSSSIITTNIGNSNDPTIHTEPSFNFSYYLASTYPPGAITTYNMVAGNFSFSFSIRVDSSNNCYVDYFVKSSIDPVRGTGLVSPNNVDGYVNIGFIDVSAFDKEEIFRLGEYRYSVNPNQYTYSTFYIAYISGNSDLPSLDMVSVEIFNGYNNPYSDVLSFSSRILNSNIVCYTDTTGAKFFIAIPVWANNDYLDSFYYDYRIYYLVPSLGLDNNQIYEQGYMNGLADNQSTIYDNGYKAGYNIGFGNGKTTGMAEANDFSFISLIGAVVDVPVQTFLGLFEFELLGINLANFFLSLLTVAVIIFVIKLVIGGK